MTFRNSEYAKSAEKLLRTQFPDFEIELIEEYKGQWFLYGRKDGCTIRPISVKEWHCSFYITCRMQCSYYGSTPKEAFDKCFNQFTTRIERMTNFIDSVKQSPPIIENAKE